MQSWKRPLWTGIEKLAEAREKLMCTVQKGKDTRRTNVQRITIKKMVRAVV